MARGSLKVAFDDDPSTNPVACAYEYEIRVSNQEFVSQIGGSQVWWRTNFDNAPSTNPVWRVCVCVCVCVCSHTYMYTYMYMYTYTSCSVHEPCRCMCVCVRVRVRVCSCIYTHTTLHARTRMCVHIYIQMKALWVTNPSYRDCNTLQHAAPQWLFESRLPPPRMYWYKIKPQKWTQTLSYLEYYCER